MKYINWCYLFQKQSPRCSVKIGFLKNFAKLTGNRLWQSLKKVDSGTGVFPVNFAKSLKTRRSIEHIKWLLLLLFILKRKIGTKQ